MALGLVYQALVRVLSWLALVVALGVFCWRVRGCLR